MEFRANGLNDSDWKTQNFIENLRVWVLSTFHFTAYKKQGWDGVMNWSGNQKKTYLDFDKLELIIVPIHLVNMNYLLKGKSLDLWLGGSIN